jgi:hypothetical protein
MEYSTAHPGVKELQGRGLWLNAIELAPNPLCRHRFFTGGSDKQQVFFTIIEEAKWLIFR